MSPAIEQRFDAQTEKDIMRVTKELQRRMHTRDVGREQKKKKQKNDNRNSWFCYVVINEMSKIQMCGMR